MKKSPVETPEQLLARIHAWRDRDPTPGIRMLPAVNVPALAIARKLMPSRSAARTLAMAYAAAVRITPVDTVLDAAEVESLDDIASLPIADNAALAYRFGRRHRWMAGGTGAVLGLAGAAGLVADVPTLLVFSLAAVLRTGQCYGESVSPSLAAALFALASADTPEEKAIAWNGALADVSARSAERMNDAALRDGLERAAEREFAKAALAGSIQRLGFTLVRRMGLRKFAAALPVVGAVAGGIVNARFIAQLTEGAELVFAARRLQADGQEGLQAALSGEVIPASSAEKPKRRRAAKATSA